MRLLLVDDQTLVRQTLKSILEPYPNIEIVGEASNGEEGVAKAAQLQPTVVIMDIVMPKLDGIGATRLIKNTLPQMAIVGLSLYAKSYEVNAMLEAGASEVIHKERAMEDLYGAIQRAAGSLAKKAHDPAA
jgi:DNA-binding NarL/FixJ family response regulator